MGHGHVPPPHFLQAPRYHADRAHGVHEVHVAAPSWDEVDVEVVGDACAGGAALVDADVDALGRQRALHEVGREFGEHPELRALLWRVVQERGARFTQGDQEVAVGVGVLIEQDEAGCGAEDDVVLLVVLGCEEVVEEEGVGGWRQRSSAGRGRAAFGGGEGFEVGEAPGRVDGGGCARLGVGRVGAAG